VVDAQASGFFPGSAPVPGGAGTKDPGVVTGSRELISSLKPDF